MPSKSSKRLKKSENQVNQPGSTVTPVETEEMEEDDEVPSTEQQAAKAAIVEIGVSKETTTAGEAVAEAYATGDTQTLSYYTFDTIVPSPMSGHPSIPKDLVIKCARNGSLEDFAKGLCDIRPNVINNLISEFYQVVNDTSTVKQSKYQTITEIYTALARWGANCNFTNLTLALEGTIGEPQKALLSQVYLVPRREGETYLVNGINMTYPQISLIVVEAFNDMKLNGRVMMMAFSYLGYSYKESLKYNSYSALIQIAGEGFEMVQAYMYFQGTSVLSKIRISPSLCMRLFEFMAIWKPLSAGAAHNSVVKAIANTNTKMVDLYTRQSSVLSAIAALTRFGPFKKVMALHSQYLSSSSSLERYERFFQRLKQAIVGVCVVAFNKAAPLEEPINVYYYSPEDWILDDESLVSLDDKTYQRMMSLKSTGLTFDRTNLESSIKYGLRPGSKFYKFMNQIPPTKGTRQQNTMIRVDKPKFRELTIGAAKISSYFKAEKQGMLDNDEFNRSSAELIKELEYETLQINSGGIKYSKESNMFVAGEGYVEYAEHIKLAAADKIKELKASMGI